MHHHQSLSPPRPIDKPRLKMQYDLRALSFPSSVIGWLGSVANMLVKNHSFLCILVALTFLVVTKTSASDKLNANKENEKKLKEETNVGNDGETTTARPLKRVKLIRIRTEANEPQNGECNSSALGKGDGKIGDQNQGYEGRVKRNVTELNEFKGAKSYKKLKLVQNQAQFGYKKWKSKKEGSNDSDSDKHAARTKRNVNRRHVAYLVHDKVGGVRSKRYAVTRNFRDDKTDYYAQRKAVMDRFYARQKEIAEKYAKKVSSTPKYIDRYDAVTEMNENHFPANNKSDTNNIEKIENAVYITDSDPSDSNFTSTTTESYTEVAKTSTETNYEGTTNTIRFTENSADDNIEEDTSDDYDYYTMEDNKVKQPSDTPLDYNGTLNDGEWKSDDNRSDTLKWGNCDGKLIYQHNLIIGVHKAQLAEADLTASVEGPFCITCIRVIPTNNNKAAVSLDVSRGNDGSLNYAKLRFKGFQNEELSYIIKMWAVTKKGDSCSHS